jgi:type IV pilus assembly protein PilY1
MHGRGSLLRPDRAARLGATRAAAAAVLVLCAAVLASPADQASELCDAGTGSLTGSTAALVTDARLFQSSYSRSTWTGNVRAFALGADGGVGTTPLWQAADRIPAAASRTIFTATSAATGVDFLWSALPAAMKEKFGDGATGEATVNYLRGDQSRERANGGTFRDRVARLGAIVNSELAFAGAEDFGYAALPGAEGSSYPAFMQAKATRGQLVIAAANDGMLHGFDAATGIERFAYVPRALVVEPISEEDPRSTLVRQTVPSFQPRYNVDGASWVGDAFIGSGWRTVVVGTAGGGARSVFAIDITDPASMSAGRLLFEHWDVGGSGDRNLGYAFGQPVIGRLSDGHFYAIFGNGRASEGQCPVLYLVRLGDGQVRRIPTGGRTLGSSCSGAPNGLGRPSLYDVQVPGETGHRITDFVYAGDLQGNLWRFDLRTLNTASDPPGGAAAQLLFSARNGGGVSQPITGTIELGTVSSSVTGNLRPVMLWFGTGRYLSSADAGDRSAQSVYGIVDRFATGGDAGAAKVVRGNLQGQTVNLVGDAAGTVSGSPVGYADGEDGWYLDLPRQGERMVGLPLVQAGRLFFATIAPEGAACFARGQSWIYAVDPHDGRALAQRVFDRRPGTDFIDSAAGLVRGVVTVDAGDRAFLYVGGAGDSGGSIESEEIPRAQQANPRGRVSWREIVR